jgi:hypothetical protein
MDWKYLFGTNIAEGIKLCLIILFIPIILFIISKITGKK